MTPQDSQTLTADERAEFDNRYPRVYASVGVIAQKLSIYEWNGDGFITIGWHVGPGAVWREAEFSPQEARQIALCILSRPCVAALNQGQG